MHKVLRTCLPLLAVVLFFNAAGVATVNAQGVLPEILKRMDDQNKSLTSLKAKVTMVKQDANLGEAGIDTMVGAVTYLPQRGKDPLIRIDWTRPEESLAVVNKKYVIYRPRLSQAITGSTDKVKGGSNAKAGGALAFMNMSRAQLKANYDVAYLGEATVSGGIKTWHLRLTPKAATSYNSAELWVDPNGFPVQAKIIEKNNDTTTVHLASPEKNVRIDASVFKINLPKGTKIVEG